MTDHIGLVVTSKCLPIVNPCKNMQNMVYCIRLVYNRAVFYVTILSFLYLLDAYKTTCQFIFVT